MRWLKLETRQGAEQTPNTLPPTRVRCKPIGVGIGTFSTMGVDWIDVTFRIERKFGIDLPLGHLHRLLAIRELYA